MNNNKKALGIFLTIVAIELAYIIYGMAGVIGSQRFHCEYEAVDLISSEDNAAEDGLGSLVYRETPEINLEKQGIYKVSIHLAAGNEGVTSIVRVNDPERENRLDTEVTDIGYMESACAYNIYSHDESLPVVIQVTRPTGEGETGELNVSLISVDYLRGCTLACFVITFLFIFGIIDIILWGLCARRTEFVAFFKSEAGLCAVILVSAVFITSTPLMLEHIPLGDDLSFHLMRIQGIADGLAGGYFPVKIHPGWFNGYGYAVGVYYGQVLLYPSAILRMVGFPLGTTYKVYVALVNILTVSIAYFSGKKLFGDRYISCAFAAFYTLSLYRLMDLYKRSAVGETAAMAFLPLVAAGLAMIYGYIKDERKHGWLWFTAGVTGIIGTHVLTMFMAAIMIILFIMMHLKETFRKETLIQYMKTAAAVILLNIYFIIPMLDYTLNLSIKMKEQKKDMIAKAAYLPQVFSQVYNVKGYNGSHTPVGDMPLSIGVSSLIVVIILICAVIKLDLEKHRKAVLCLSVIFAMSVWMATNLFPYAFFKNRLEPVYSLLQHLQYPWRFLSISSGVIAILFGVALLVIKEGNEGRTLVYVSIVVILVTLIQSKGMEDAIVQEIDGKAYYNPFYDFYYSNEYIPRNTDMEELFDTDLYTSSADVIIADVDRKGINYTVSVDNSSEDIGYVQLPLICYPHYIAKDENGNRLEVVVGDYYKLCFAVPGDYTGAINVRFKEPIYWRIAEMISVSALIWVVILIKKTEVQIRDQ